MKELKKLVHERLKDRTDISFEQFISATNDFEFRPFYLNENLICIVMIKDSEVHVITSHEYEGHGLSRKLFKETLSEIFNRHGFVSTKIMKNHHSGIRLAEWLGFRKISEEGNILNYKMEQTNVWSQ